MCRRRRRRKGRGTHGDPEKALFQGFRHGAVSPDFVLGSFPRPERIAKKQRKTSSWRSAVLLIPRGEIHALIAAMSGVFLSVNGEAAEGAAFKPWAKLGQLPPCPDSIRSLLVH